MKSPSKYNFQYSFDGYTEYIKIGDGLSSETVEIRPGLNLDLNDGKVVGIELIRKHDED